MLNLEKAIKEALENYETRLNIEHERAETWKAIALETGKKLIDAEKELALLKALNEAKKIYLAPKHQRPICFEELIYGKKQN